MSTVLCMVRVYSAGDNVLNLLLDRPKKIGEYMFIKIINVKIAKLHWFTLITGPQARCVSHTCETKNRSSVSFSLCMLVAKCPLGLWRNPRGYKFSFFLLCPLLQTK